MTAASRSLLRRALALFTLHLVVSQILLGLIVCALFVLWLRLPDASAIDVIGSGLLALLILFVAGAGETFLVLRLTASPWTLRKLLRGTLALSMAAALWFGSDAILTHLEARNTLLAGYLNSRFPHSMRNVFSYPHILLWLEWLGAVLRIVIAGILGLSALVMVTYKQPFPSVIRALRSGTYWLALLLGCTITILISRLLLDWTPVHGVAAEVFSLFLRVTLVVILYGALVSLLLAILAACEREFSLRYEIPVGTPDDNHPRTAGIP